MCLAVVTVKHASDCESRLRAATAKLRKSFPTVAKVVDERLIPSAPSDDEVQDNAAAAFSEAHHELNVVAVLGFESLDLQEYIISPSTFLSQRGGEGKRETGR